jgi:hypothetical protein
VIEAEEMEQAVDHEMRHLVVERAMPLPGLLRRNRKADHDIAEHCAPVARVVAFHQREREDVRRPLSTAPGLVQLRNFGIVDERKREFRARVTEAPESPHRTPLQSAQIQVNGSLLRRS